ncbi:MAG: MATE family efflux transporter [Lachnospiraceae bacterium]|nr:MATE family efflux transporter [Lachnospiraceae bacterium]
MNEKKRLVINLTAQIMAFTVNMGVSFIVTPIIESISTELSGFVGMANNFITCAQIVVSALNTMASRFITIHIHKKDEQQANEYFSSVFFGNLMMAGIFLIPMLTLVIFIDSFFQVPALYVSDVRILWLFLFGNFFVSIVGSVFSVSTYCKNRLDLNSVRTIHAEILRVVFLVTAYNFFPKYIWYIGVAALLHTTYLTLSNIQFTKRLLPEIHIKEKYFCWKKVWELISLGLWNSLTRLSQVLLDELDIMISNIFISATAMSALSNAKYVPTAISGLMATVVGVFSPQITIAYAEGDKKKLIDIIKSSNRIMIFIMSIPIAFVTAYGDIFFSLWLPRRDPHEMHLLAVLGMGVLYVSMSIQVLYHVFIITKKVKANSIVMIISGVLSTAIVFVLLQTTNLGLYAIAGVSTVLGLLRNLIFTPIYASKCLEIKWSTFYSDIFTGFLSIASITAVGLVSRWIVDIGSYVSLIGVGIVVGIIALGLNFLIILKKEDRKLVIDKVMRRG